MKLSLFPSISVLACILLAAPAVAERADRTKPMNIEADALRHDEARQTSVFTGRVVLTKGTMVIRGARLDVRQDAQGYQFGVVTAEPGKLAFFRQKRDTPPGALEEFMEGEAEVIEYDGRADTVRFRQRAQLRRFAGTQLNDEMTGALIVYDNSTSVLTVDGGPARADGQPGRVRAMLTPRTDEASGAAAPAPAPTPIPAPVLRRSPATGGVGR